MLFWKSRAMMQIWCECFRERGEWQEAFNCWCFCSASAAASPARRPQVLPLPQYWSEIPGNIPSVSAMKIVRAFLKRNPAQIHTDTPRRLFSLKYPLSLMINLLCGVGVYLRTGSVEARQLCVFPIHVLSPHRQRQEPSTEAVQEELGLR